MSNSNGLCKNHIEMEITDKCIFHGALEERFHSFEGVVTAIEKRTTRLENFVLSLLVFIAAASSFSGYLLYHMPTSVAKEVRIENAR